MVLRLVVRLLTRTTILVTYCAILVVLWGLTVKIFNINSLLLPGPSSVWKAIEGYPTLLLQSTLYTLAEAMLGFAAAIVVGIVLAAIIVLSATISRIILPTLAAINASPKVVVAPMLAIWLGIGGMTSKIAMAFLLAFFPIVISCIQGMSDVEPDLLNLYHLMRCNRLTVMRRVRLPNAIPHLISGMKIALPLTIIGAVIEEYVAAEQGIGHEIVLAYSNFNTNVVFAGIIVITTASVLLFQALTWIEHRIIKWRPTSYETR